MCGRIAALLVAVPPQALLIWSTKARGGFIELVLIGTAALVATLLWLHDDRRKTRWIAAVGLLLGLGWWVNNQIVYFIPAIGLAFITGIFGFYREPVGRRFFLFFKQAGVGLVTFLLGSLPFWIYNLTSDPRFETIRFLLRPAENGKAFEYFCGFLTTSLPILFGARGFWQHEDLFRQQVWLFGLGAAQYFWLR